MTAPDHRALADALMPAVLAAGRVEMHYYAAGAAVELKADQSPVTAADREAEALLVAAIGRAAPGIAIVAEEDVAAQGKAPAVSETFFLVDPLDGTREFVGRRAEFTINIALVSRGTPVFGIVYAPAMSDLFVTLGHDRAFAAKVDPDASYGGLDALNLRPLAAREPDPAALVALASRSHMTAETDAWLKRFQIASYKQTGSSLKFCVLAQGLADLYPRLGPTAEWDTAAGHAVLAAAGGSVMTLDGAPLHYGKADSRFLNPHFVATGRNGRQLVCG